MKTAVYAHNAAIWLASLAVVEWSNWALVLVAIVTAGVIGWQSWETRKAAEAAKEAADAARENSKALMDSTRAWVTVEPDDGIRACEYLMAACLPFVRSTKSGFTSRIAGKPWLDLETRR